MRVQQYELLLDKSSGRNYAKRKRLLNYDTDGKALTSPGAVYEFMDSVYGITGKAEEHVYVIGVNNKNKVLGIFQLSMGSINLSIVNPRDVFIRALLIGAVSVILVHNHPSLDTKPSEQDIQVTKRLHEAGDLLGVLLLDHVIVGDGYCSLKEQGLIR